MTDQEKDLLTEQRASDHHQVRFLFDAHTGRANQTFHHSFVEYRHHTFYHRNYKIMCKTANPLPSLARLQKAFSYDPQSGEIEILDPSVSFYATKQCYRIRIDKTVFALHRCIFKLMTGIDPTTSQIDHKDGNPFNNSWDNLRLASQAENLRNRGKFKNNKTGYKGVIRDKSKTTKVYRAQICFEYRNVTLGWFDTPELAHQAYCDAATALHRDFARLQ